MTKTLTGPPEDRHLFIVRVWREESQATPGGQWRGSVEHVPSGQRVHFVSLDALTAFVSKYLTTNTAHSSSDHQNT